MHDSILGLPAPENAYEDDSDFGPIRRPAGFSFSTEGRQTFCYECQRIVTTVNPAQAAAAFNTDLQDIGFLLKKNEIHMIRRDPAVISICRASLEFSFESRQTRLLDSHFEIVRQPLMSGLLE